MERKEFLKQAGAIGLCSCTIASAFAAASVGAAEEPKTVAPAPKPEDGRLAFAQQRYNRMIAALAARTDTKTVDAVLEDVGRFCGGKVGLVVENAGNPDGFLAAIAERWKAEVSYDREHGTVALAFPPSDDCHCPLLSKALSPAAACQCSLGWQKQAFETVFARPVDVELKESALRGGRRCAFEIRVGPKPPA